MRSILIKDNQGGEIGMNCPNCGNNMDQPGQCPVCGTMVGGYNLAQDTPVQPQPDMQNQGFDPSFGGDMGVYQMDPSMTTAPAKKSPVGKIIAIIAIVAVIAVGAFFVIKFVGGGNGKSQVEAFLKGLSDMDADAIAKTVDPDVTDDEEIDSLTQSFALMEGMGIELEITYDIGDAKKGDKTLIESIKDELYDGEDVKISEAYVYDCTVNVKASYMGESQDEDENMQLVAYKKDGKWYVGGTAE